MINCSDSTLLYKDMDSEGKKGFVIAWMKIILNDKLIWENRFEMENWINKSFEMNLFEEFKKMIDEGE